MSEPKIEWREGSVFSDLYIDDRPMGCVRKSITGPGWFVALYGTGSVYRVSEVDAKQYLESWAKSGVSSDRTED